jgi:hypothetical protein
VTAHLTTVPDTTGKPEPAGVAVATTQLLLATGTELEVDAPLEKVVKRLEDAARSSSTASRIVHQVVLQHPIAQRGRHQKRLLTIASDEAGGHAVIVLAAPDATFARQRPTIPELVEAPLRRRVRLLFVCDATAPRLNLFSLRACESDPCSSSGRGPASR